MPFKDHDLIVITGPTATGKTSLAANLASKINGSIISADSRQVYRDMTIGTGKDISDYTVNGKNIPYYLIDICEPGEEYNVFRYKKDFVKAFEEINRTGRIPVMCGGSGLYIHSVLKDYKLINVPVDPVLRKHLAAKTDDELTQILKELTSIHNTTDTLYRKRLIRAIEIAYFQNNNDTETQNEISLSYKVFGLKCERKTLKNRITERLRTRLKEGMAEEAKQLIDKGVSVEKLKYYGLEYKYLAEYIEGKYNYNDMYQKLNSAIHRFSKRQMTWFRKMEKEDIDIKWIDTSLPLDKKLDIITGSFS